MPFEFKDVNKKKTNVKCSFVMSFFFFLFIYQFWLDVFLFFLGAVFSWVSHCMAFFGASLFLLIFRFYFPKFPTNIRGFLFFFQTGQELIKDFKNVLLFSLFFVKSMSCLLSFLFFTCLNYKTTSFFGVRCLLYPPLDAEF